MKLKPCPFCDYQCPELLGPDRDGYAVHCHKCGARGRIDSDKEVAIKFWNVRGGHWMHIEKGPPSPSRSLS
jgi:hypothetical protein